MGVLLPTHNASVHRILKLLPSITLCRIQHSLSCSNLPLRIGFCNLQPKRSSKIHPPGKGLAFCPEYVCSDITGFSGLHLCPSLCFLLSPNEPKTVHPCDLILRVSSLLHLQVAIPECESGMYSRLITLGEKTVDEKARAFSLILV